MNVKWVLSYIQFIDWLFTYLDPYGISFNLNIVAGMSLAVWQEVITLYDCEIIIILYPVHWLILSMFDLYVVYFHLNYCSQYVICCFIKYDFFVWLWNDYHRLSSSLIHSLLDKIFTSFLFHLDYWSWYIFGCLSKKWFRCTFCEMMFSLFPVHWLILYLLWSIFLFFPLELL